MIENIPFAYQDHDGDDEDADQLRNINNNEEIKVLDKADYRILDHFGIPSSHKLLETESSPADDVRKVKNKMPDLLAEKWQKNCERMTTVMQARGDLPKRIDQFLKVMK
jgi:hypothetical protein